jgi:5,10-methylenetetrahydromethanopterin reductase
MTLIDMPFVGRDVHTLMTMSALNTRSILIGHGVTTPVLFHPMSIANATASINELSGGRAFVGLGVGGPFESVVGRVAPVKEMRETVQFIRSFMAGEVADYRGVKAHSEWARDPVPIYIAAERPRMLHLAGEIADGVISIGTNPEWVRWKMKQVEKGALKAGRDPAEVEFWVRTMIYVADNKEDAREEVAPYPLAYGHLHTLLQQGTPEAVELRQALDREYPGMSEDLIADSEKVASAYEPYGVERLDAPWAKYVTGALIDYFHLTGRPEDINERISVLGEMGVKNISTVMFTVLDKIGMMQAIRDEIMPNFQD